MDVQLIAIMTVLAHAICVEVFEYPAKALQRAFVLRSHYYVRMPYIQ